MADALSQWVALSVQLVAAAAMMAIAAGIVYLNRHSRVTRAFAFVLVVDAAIIVALRLRNASAPTGVLENARLASGVDALVPFLRVAFVPAVLLLLLAYKRSAATA